MQYPLSPVFLISLGLGRYGIYGSAFKLCIIIPARQSKTVIYYLIAIGQGNPACAVIADRQNIAVNAFAAVQIKHNLIINRHGICAYIVNINRCFFARVIKTDKGYPGRSLILQLFPRNGDIVLSCGDRNFGRVCVVVQAKSQLDFLIGADPE